MKEIRDYGYSIDEGVLSSVECDSLLREVNSSTNIARGRAGMRHLMTQPVIRTIASDPRMIAIASAALGAAAVPYRATLFEKSGAANWLVVWHQDKALPLDSEFEQAGWGPWSRKCGVIYAHAPAWALSRIIALRIHLDPSTEDNGPLRVLPGTHQSGAISDSEVLALSRTIPSVTCVCARGGVMAMHPLLIHSSSKARVESPRRVLHIEYTGCVELAPGIRLAVA